MEKTTILRVLAQTNGHQQKAAELLGISRRTLSRKLKLYGREAVRHILRCRDIVQRDQDDPQNSIMTAAERRSERRHRGRRSI